MSKRTGIPGGRAWNKRDLVGRRFRRLIVTGDTGRRACNGSVIWRCICDCAEVREVITTNLTRGNTLSCGCLHREISAGPSSQRPFAPARLKRAAGKEGRNA